MDFFYFFLGVILLFLGAEWLVKASASLAFRWNVTPLVIGTVIVGFGTGLPELLVSIEATIKDYPTIAAGNIVGSNILNVALILGIALLIRPAKVSQSLKKFSAPIMVWICALLWVLHSVGTLNRLGGFLLLFVLFLYTVFSIYLGKKEFDPTELSQEMKWRLDICLIMIPISFVLVFSGAHLFLKGAISIGRSFGIPGSILGISIVALGTSLPELATSIIAAAHRQTSLIVGNIVGSNIFNILGVIGSMGLIHPFHFGKLTNVDYGIMVGVNFLFLIFVLFQKKIYQWQGAFFLLVYVGYWIYLSMSLIEKNGGKISVI